MSLLSSLVDYLKPPRPPSPAIKQALQRVAELVDPLLQADPAFDRTLSPALEYALGYCDGLVAALPGPLELSRQAFSRDPLVHALFATADDIDQMLGRSQAVRDYLATPDCWDSDSFYALFSARRQEKKQLGMSVQGDIVQTDVPQTVVFFSNQTLIEPNGELALTLERLRSRALDSLLQSFHAHVEALRHERDGMRADLSIERAHLTILRGQTSGPEYEICTRHIDELDTHLREMAESLQPEHLIPALAAFLRAPEPSLSLRPVSLTVNRLGVITEQCAPGDAETIHFPELISRDQRLHLVLLAKIRRAEAREAVERVNDQQHRFMII